MSGDTATPATIALLTAAVAFGFVLHAGIGVAAMWLRPDLFPGEAGLRWWLVFYPVIIVLVFCLRMVLA